MEFIRFLDFHVNPILVYAIPFQTSYTVSMSYEDPGEMSPEEIKDIETMPHMEVLSSMMEPGTEENVFSNYQKVIEKVRLGSKNYHLEETPTGISVVQTSDKKVIYFTTVQKEIDSLREESASADSNPSL